MLAKKRAYFDYCIDEYQDLNKAEQTLIDLLGEQSSISIVGDIDQSIYGFRYANFNGIEDFSTRHNSVEDRTLNQCRRCDKKIVSLADSLIKYNHPAEKSSRLNSDPRKAEGPLCQGK